MLNNNWYYSYEGPLKVDDILVGILKTSVTIRNDVTVPAGSEFFVRKTINLGEPTKYTVFFERTEDKDEWIAVRYKPIEPVLEILKERMV